MPIFTSSASIRPKLIAALLYRQECVACRILVTRYVRVTNPYKINFVLCNSCIQHLHTASENNDSFNTDLMD